MKYLILFALSFYHIAWAQSAAEAIRITSSTSSFYEVLNVAPDASDAEIKKAYRRLMSLYHPDRHQNNPANLKAATQVMTKLNTVRETLLDPLKRKSYDVTVKATASVKPAAAKTSSTKPATDWQKYTYNDFSKSAKPEAKTDPKPKSADADKKTQPSSFKETSEKPAVEQPKASPKAAASTSTVSAEAEPRAAEAKERTVRKVEPTSTTGKMATKMYRENSNCSLDYFGRFVDIMQ